MSTHRRELLKAIALAGAFAGLRPFDLAAGLPGRQEAPTMPREATDGPWRNLRAVREKKVIDFHAHAWETATQADTLRGTGLLHREGHYVDFTDQLLASMDRCGVALAALSPMFVGYQRYAGGKYGQHKNRFVLMAGVQAIQPRPSPQEAAAILRGQLQAGARGIGEGGLPPWEEPQDLKPVMDLAVEFDVPVLIHTGWSATVSSNLSLGSAYRASWRFAEQFGALAANYPDVKLVMGHIGGRFEEIDGWEALRVAFSFDNIYLETSKSTPRIVTEGVRGVGAERVLYGSDWNRPEMKTYGPLHMRDVYQHWYSLNVIAQADLTEDQRDMILYKNATRLLKIG